MQLFKKILLVHADNGDEQVNFDRAVALAGENKAELTVFQVVEQLPRDYSIMITSQAEEEMIMKLGVREHVHNLEKMVSGVRERIRITVKVVVGREYLEVIKEVLRNGHDLVMKTVRSKGGVKGALFGSTAMNLLRECPCPVWLIKPETGKRFKKIMVAVDVIPGEEEDQALNDQIMHSAVSVIGLGASELHVVNVWKKIGKNLLTYAAGYFPDEDITREMENKHIGWLDDLVSRHDLESIFHYEHILHGRADEVIVNFAKEHEIDLVIMGTVCRTGIPGFFIGNTAEKILNRVQSSVLALKPEGFISPVSELR